MIYRFGDCELDDRRHELRRGGARQHLEPQVFQVLLYLVRNRDRVVARNELLDQIWGSRFVTDSALTSRLKAARKAVGDSGRAQQVIGTVHGRGYRFLAPVQQQPAEAPETPAVPRTPPVGREGELERLAGLLDLAAGGRRQVVFVTGEPGIGKTTLVEALADAAARGGALVARGQCLEHRGPPEPYLPVFDALARLCRAQGEVVGQLSHLAPGWLVQMPAFVAPGDREQLERRALGTTTERLLREAAEALAAVGAERPLVLVIEDLHWADPSTVDLVDWLARSDVPARLLVLGSYRPADAQAAGHPIDAAAASLRLSGLAAELRLGELDLPAVAALLGRRLPGAEVPEELARLVHRHTDGVPLFVTQLAQAWVDTGVLRPAGGRWELASRPQEGGHGVPDELRRLIELQLGRLDEIDLAMLEAAAVGGVEFAAAAAAGAAPGTTEAVEERCTALARQGRFLVEAGPVDWPDGTVSAGFRFAHELHRSVLYDRIPAGRRARLHAAVAGRLEQAYGPAAADHAAELATRFLQARDHPKAVRYLQAAAEQALRRSAEREALAHLDSHAEALARLPHGPGRDQAELAALLLRAPALVATQGFASPEAEAAYDRGRQLSLALGRQRELALVLYGLAAVNEFRARYHVSEALLEEVLTISDSGLAVEAHELLACSTFHQGAAERAVRYAEEGLAIFAEQPHLNWFLAPYGEHPAVSCHDWASLASWFLGRPDSALRHAEQSLHLASEHPYSLASAQVQRAYLHQFRGEAAETLHWAGRALETATAGGYPIRAVQGAILAAWARTAVGGDGVDQLRQGLAGYLATGAELDHPYYLGLLGHALALRGEVGEGLAVVEEAIRLAGTERPFYYLPELHRLRGDLLAQDRAADAAATAYSRAMELAAAQGARSPELRAAAALCRLPARSRPAGARERLRRLYDRFEEGLDSPDLVAASELAGAGSPPPSGAATGPDGLSGGRRPGPGPR